MKLTNNTSFFEQNVEQFGDTQKKDVPNMTQHRNHVVDYSNGKISLIVKQIIETLEKSGFSKMAIHLERIYKDLLRERFVISVVGEFSRGKSTFLNNLLDNAAKLPVANLPTTAVLTRIRYARKNIMAIFDDNGNRIGMKPISENSWKNLVVDNFNDNELNCSVIVGVTNPWIGKNNIEFIDCPGAGDLSESRARKIGDVLNRTDGAIIAIDATQALSNTEKLFIKNRIVGRSTPFTMLILNKLDLVNKKERNGVIKYVKDVLKLNKIDMPVLVPYDIEMSDDQYKTIIGMDKVKDIIVNWINNPKRQALTNKWISYRISEVVDMAVDSLNEQKKLLLLDNKKKADISNKKKLALDKLSLSWGELSIELQKKSNECYTHFLDKTDEYSHLMIEKLQYESAHASVPEKWWKEDYPYRLKVELANMSTGLENIVTKDIAADAKWFNELLNKQFKSVIEISLSSITDKKEYMSVHSEREIEFEDLGKKQNMARIGTVGASIASFFVLNAIVPGLGIIGTMGLGAGGTILSNKFFKKQLDKQHDEIKQNIARDIPLIVSKAVENSESRIKHLYEEMLTDSEKKKEVWYEAQKLAIECENKTESAENMSNIENSLETLLDLKNKLINIE